MRLSARKWRVRPFRQKTACEVPYRSFSSSTRVRLLCLRASKTKERKREKKNRKKRKTAANKLDTHSSARDRLSLSLPRRMPINTKTHSRYLYIFRFRWHLHAHTHTRACARTQRASVPRFSRAASHRFHRRVLPITFTIRSTAINVSPPTPPATESPGGPASAVPSKRGNDGAGWHGGVEGVMPMSLHSLAFSNVIPHSRAADGTHHRCRTRGQAWS